MFDSDANKHEYFNSACRRFTDAHNVAELAPIVKISTQVLRNKLNPEQPHQLTGAEIIRLTKASGDRALIDGLLMQSGCLPSVPYKNQPADISLQTLNASAALGEIAQEVSAISTGGRVTQSRKNKILERTSHLIACASMIAISLEYRFHSTPTIAAAVDFVNSVALMPGLV